MNEELIGKLIRIVEQLPDENSCLDYKLFPYDNEKMPEFVKDLCAFLNSEEAYNKDKYVMIGIGDKKNIIGLTTVPMQDDRFYQAAADCISPRPLIETGTFKHKIKGKEFTFGYIYISKENTDRVYEINKDCFYKQDKNEYTLDKAFHMVAVASTAWIRRGSCKRVLDEYTRRKIYEADRNKKNFSIDNNIIYSDINKSANNKIIKAALLIGKWNEENENDKKIIEKYVGITYENFVNQLRLISKNENDFAFKKGIWKINNRASYIKDYALDFYKEDFDNFYNVAIEVLKEKHPKLDLSNNERCMYKIYGKFTKFSNEIRDGISESLVLLEYLKNDFENCKIYVSNCVVLCVREILEDSNWYIWASLDKCLPYLAEASSSEFLRQLENYLSNDKELKVLFENESGITTYNYSVPIYWSLELIAWNTDNCVRACMILSKLAKKDEKAIEHIANIILPWYPHTFAPFLFRKTIVENILKQDINVGWTLIKKIMPGEITYSVSTYKPKYINVPEDQTSITYKEYYDQIDEYIKLMINYCKLSNKRLIDMINLLNKVSKESFDRICNYLTSSKIKNKSDKGKYELWDKIKSLIHSLKKQKNIKESIKKEMLDKLKYVVETLKPNDYKYIISRLFKKDSWDLIEDYNNYNDSEKKLDEKRFIELKKIYEKEGINSIINLANVVENSYKLGFILADIKLTLKEEKLILYCLDKNDNMVEFAKGYVYKKYNLDKQEYNIKWLLDISVKAKNNFLQMLPYTITTFENVEKLLKKEYKKYWLKVDIRLINDEITLKYGINKLLEVKRYSRVLWMYRLSLNNNENIEYDANIVLICLEKMNKNFNQYDICEAIRELQNRKVDENRLFYIEWKYLPLLNNESYRPITMEKKIASDVTKYVEILELAYKEHSKEKDNRNVDQNIATNAYRLLRQWKFVPGTQEDGFIDGKKLNLWYEKMKEKCKEKDRFEVGLSCFGHVLFYSPKSKNGFWIDKNVAEILNDNDNDIIRKGFKNEAFNSVGIVNWDENGLDYLKKRDEYRVKAEDTELEGYYNFATALREISDNFEFHAEHMSDSFDD